MTLKKLSLEIQINVMQLIFEAINDKSSIVKSVTTAKEDKFLLVVKDRWIKNSLKIKGNVEMVGILKT